MQNKSFTYLLPLFCKYFYKENSELEEILFICFVENCYVYQKVNEKSEKKFILKIQKPEKSDEIFRKFFFNLKKSSIFTDLFVETDGFYLKFNIPNSLKFSYNKFVNGEYSKIKDEDKRLILQFTKNHISLDFSNDVNQVFNKSNRLKEKLEDKLGMIIPNDMELSSVPDKLSETFIN